MIKRVRVKIPAATEAAYPILIAAGLFENLGKWLPKKSNNLIIITDKTVQKLYGLSLDRYLKNQGFNVLLIAFPAGEKSKNIKTKQYIENQMLRHHVGRDALILALGGGVVGDIAGFVAATYMRGIPYIQIPTTFLAMVDSSVGGKTGIDHAQGKNLIGAFWQPKIVVADINSLKTLSKKHIVNGLIEALKMFLTHDKKSFYYAKNNMNKILISDNIILKSIIHRAVKIKAAVVSQDETEINLRMILNFGHTFGHALERVSNYKILHGYAVAYGILVEAKMAQMLGWLDEKSYLRIQEVLNQLGIMGKSLQRFDINKIIHTTKLDKKSKAGNVRYVLLKKIGEIYKINHESAHPVADSIVRKAFLQVIGV